jgi:hypothetical protein
MKLVNTMMGQSRQIVKGAEIKAWLALERLALRVLAHSWRHVTPAQRHARAVHSEAWRKLTIIPIRRAQLN